MVKTYHPAEKVMAKYHLERRLTLKPRMLPEDTKLIAQGDELFRQEAELLNKDPAEVAKELSQITREQTYAARENPPAIMRYGHFERQENLYRVIFELHTLPLPETEKELDQRIQGDHNWNILIQKASEYSQRTMIAAYLEKDGEHKLLELDLEADSTMRLPATLLSKIYPAGTRVDAEEFTETVLRAVLPKFP